MVKQTEVRSGVVTERSAKALATRMQRESAMIGQTFTVQPDSINPSRFAVVLLDADVSAAERWA